jgi:hypothetical protein
VNLDCYNQNHDSGSVNLHVDSSIPYIVSDNVAVADANLHVNRDNVSVAGSNLNVACLNLVCNSAYDDISAAVFKS